MGEGKGEEVVKQGERAAGRVRWKGRVFSGGILRGGTPTGFCVIVFWAGGAESGSRDPRLLIGRPYGTRGLAVVGVVGVVNPERCSGLVWGVPTERG